MNWVAGTGSARLTWRRVSLRAPGGEGGRAWEELWHESGLCKAGGPPSSSLQSLFVAL